MKIRLKDKNRAIELRKLGFSYKEIQKEISVSKGLLSGWLKYIRLSANEEAFLKKRMMERQNEGRIKTIFTNRSNRAVREKKVEDEAKIDFQKFCLDPVFLIGVALYWAEGSKRDSQFNFVNSDSDMIIFMYKWIQKFLLIGHDKIKIRLFIHDIPGYENSQIFWSEKLAVEPYLFQKTIYKKTPHNVKKNPDYQGCVRLGVGGIRYLRVMKAWQKLLIQYYSNKL